MAKNKKSESIPKKKGNVAAVADSTNGKFKNKSGGLLNKKQKNKKIKKAGGDNSPVKSTILTDKNETIIDVNESNGQETNNSSPKKVKKGKNVIVTESVAGEILANPKVAKKKSKKKMVETVTEPVSPTKANKNRNVAQGEGEEANVVPEKPTKSDKERKNSTTEDEDDEVEMEPTEDEEDDEIEMEPASGTDEDEDSDVSPKKQKLKKTKTNDETADGAEKGEFESFQ